ncbi:MAG TPA: response regulator [Chthoniobacterales bacterium]
MRRTSGEGSNPGCAKANPLRVLLVEDSTPVRGRIRSLVEENGRVEIVGEVNSVVDALAQFREQAPDAMILDLYLKDGNSVGVVTEVKRAKSRCAVIVLTSFATLETREHCLGLGADYFFEKNQEFERVPEVLAELHRLKNEAAI